MPGTKREIGVVSDTHDLLRPQVLEVLQGVEHIIHAGDVGGPEILEGLASVAPVSVVRGNTDHGPFGQTLPEWDVVSFGDLNIYVIHNLAELDLDPQAAGFRAVVYGHTHQPKQEIKRGVLYLNPGSIGPRRFRLPISLAKLRITGKDLQVEFIELQP